MKFMDFRKHFTGREVFTLAEIRAIEPSFYRARLNEWQDRGYIKKLLRNYYFFSETSFDERALFRAANRVYSPSYVSMQSALSYYGIIPEKPLSIISVSTLKTSSFTTPLGRMDYRKISGRYFFGYGLEGTGAAAFMMAGPAKAILDIFYYEADPDSDAFISGLRLNYAVLRKLIGGQDVLKMARLFRNRKVAAAAGRIFGK